MLYEILTICLRPGTLAEANRRLVSSPPQPQRGATLLGFWNTEIGVLNQLISLWSRRDEEPLAGVRDTLSGDSDWLRSIAELVTDIRSEHFRLFPFLSDVQPGKYGSYYEMRSYLVKFDTMSKVIERWQPRVGERSKLSPLLAALYSVGGPLQKFVHIWPYQSLDERIRLRALAIEKGIWPPPGGAETLSYQESSILLPAPFSPLQ
jgi:NIPSNAP protein